MSLIDQLKKNLDRSDEYEDDVEGVRPSVPPVRVIAYYLPQFHPIPENDEWWGKGFTEWTNVTKAIPRFAGHYQPKLPGALGFYDLRIPDVLNKQAELAKKAGIHGFCFHYYWFSGKQLLEQPLNLLLNHPDIDIPFCINWANENWSRRWDGMDSQILIRQVYSPDDDISFARSLEGALADKRYIRIDGRPLLMLYRPELLPDAAATIDRWREFFTARGFGNPYFVMPQVFEQFDPTLFGMDAAAGFPPHKFRWDLRSLLPSLERFDPSYHGRVFMYQDLAALAMEFRPKEYKLFHGVCPAWDNCPRKPRDGVSFIGSTPTIYGRWLANACYKALQDPKQDERIVFINAWNEWGEGAYLEPDRHKGHAYLNETARVISNLNVKALNSKVDGSASVPNLHLDNSSKRLFLKLRTRAANHLEKLTNTVRPR